MHVKRRRMDADVVAPPIRGLPPDSSFRYCPLSFASPRSKERELDSLFIDHELLTLNSTVESIDSAISQQKQGTHDATTTVTCHVEARPTSDIQDDPLLSFQFTILARYPILPLVGKNGCVGLVVLAYAEVESVCGVLRTLRLRFPGLLAQCLDRFLGPNDRIEVQNFRLPAGLSLFKLEEIQFGAQLRRYAGGLDELPETSDRVLLSVRRPRYSEAFVVCYCHSGVKLCVISHPTWATLPPAFCFSERLLGLALCDDVSFKTPVPSGPFLAHISSMAKFSLEGCIVDVSRGIRWLTLPNYGRVAAVNLDVVDPSIVSTLRVSLLTSNPVRYVKCECIWTPKDVLNRVSVLIVARHPEGLPLVACGDLIRIENSRLTFQQDFRTGAVYLDAHYRPGTTTAKLWRLDDFVRTSSAIEDGFEICEGGKNVSPYWCSMHPQRHDNKQGEHSVWSQDEVSEVAETCPDTFEQLSLWAADSLYRSDGLNTMYQTSLWRLQEVDPGRQVDVVVRILGLENLHSTSPEFFNTQSSVREPPPVIRRYVVSHPNQQHGCTSTPSDAGLSFRIRVTDDSLTESDADSLWILTNFSSETSAHLHCHLREGEFVRVRYVTYGGVKRLEKPSQFLPNGVVEADYYFLDASRCRLTKLPRCSWPQPAQT